MDKLLIEKKKTKAYDQAVEILIDLSELAEIQDQTAEFKIKTNELLARYSSLSALKTKLKSAQLLWLLACPVLQRTIGTS